MFSLELFLLIGGLLHFATLIASAQVPREMNFKEELPKLSPLLRQWVVVSGLYIVLNIIAFGAVSVLLAEELAEGTALARAFCGYVSIFWGIRLLIQLFVFDAKPYLRNWFLKAGYHCLTLVFLYQTAVYGYAAIN